MRNTDSYISTPSPRTTSIFNKCLLIQVHWCVRCRHRFNLQRAKKSAFRRHRKLDSIGPRSSTSWFFVWMFLLMFGPNRAAIFKYLSRLGSLRPIRVPQRQVGRLHLLRNQHLFHILEQEWLLHLLQVNHRHFHILKMGLCIFGKVPPFASQFTKLIK